MLRSRQLAVYVDRSTKWSLKLSGTIFTYPNVYISSQCPRMSPVRYCCVELSSVAFSSYEHLPFQGSRLEGKTFQSRGKGLQIEIEWLSSSAHCIGNGPVKVVDLEEGHWVEKPAPEGILLSARGLLLKQKSTLLCLRTRVAPPPPVSIRSDV